jgi:dihydrofolate reductase
MFKKIAIMAAFYMLDRLLINRITFEPLRLFFRNLLSPAKNVADILTNENPNNAEEMKAFWEKNQMQLLDNSLETAKSIINVKVKDEILRTAILAILDELDDAIPGDTPSIIAVRTDFVNSIKLR